MCHCGNTGVEQTPNKSQYRKSTLERKHLPPLLPGFELTTFPSHVRLSYQQAIPAPSQQRRSSSQWGNKGHQSTRKKSDSLFTLIVTPVGGEIQLLDFNVSAIAEGHFRTKSSKATGRKMQQKIILSRNPDTGRRV